MDIIQINSLTVDELKEIIRQSVENSKSENPLPIQNKRDEKYATRKEVAKALHISLPTLHEMTKRDTIPGYRIGGRILYKWEEVDKCLEKVECLKYKRGL